jgi:hypothetical protein
MVVAFTDPTVHPAAGAFYTTFQWEPVAAGREIRVERVREIRHLTMETLLDEIPAQAGAGGIVFVVFHGTERGLSMPLIRGSHVHANAEVMALLDSARSDGELAPILRFGDHHGRGGERVRELREKVQAVKQLRLSCVELRACNTGAYREAMQTAKDFFGAGTLGAPDIRDSYFTIDPGSPNPNASFWQRWLRSHPRNHTYEVPANGKLALAVRLTAHSAFQTSALVNQTSAVGFWIDTYLSRLHPTPSLRHRSFPAHALWSSAAAFPLVLPGDDDYAGHIAHV